MTDTDIRTALERATGDLSTPPDLLDRVRAGGRRRVVRRRTMLAAGLTTVVAGSTAGVVLSAGGDGATPVASPLLDDPTRGDLRRDREFRDQVHAAWRAHVGAIPVRGEPHLVWAGLAPHGFRAAVVTQRVPQRPVSPAGQLSIGLMGFVEHTGAGLRVISMEEILTDATNSSAALLGPDRDIVMVLGDGRGVRYSPRFTYTAEGRISRTFTPLNFAAQDGVAFEAAGKQTNSIQIALRADSPDATGSLAVGLANLWSLAPAADVPRTGSSLLARPLPGRDRAWPSDEAVARDGLGRWDLAGQDGFADPYGYPLGPPAGTWLIRGATADRRRFVVQTMTAPDRRSRLFLLLGTPEPVLEGFVDPGAPLPVRVRLPDRQGVVVAAEGAALRYRTRNGPWLPVGGDAALLPDAADEVEVTGAGGRTVRVGLPD